jgi:ubiquinol-cytochrome c reductase cytochrome c1 subunit
MSALVRWIAVILLVAAGGAFAAESGGLRLEPAPIHRLDNESLQRGARDFVNYCLSCHSAQYMRYNRLADLGLTEQQIKDNLMFASDRVGSTMTVAMSKADATAWFGAAPPDLSVEARVRGANWLYSYLSGFYRDEKAPTGWNNLVLPNVAMPHVLWALQGVNKLVETEYEDREKAEAAAIAAKSLAQTEQRPDGKYVVKTLVQETPGALTAVEYQGFVADLVNFLDYMAEPARNERINAGIGVMIFLGVLFAFAYALKRNYWKDVH